MTLGFAFAIDSPLCDPSFRPCLRVRRKTNLTNPVGDVCAEGAFRHPHGNGDPVF
jgi:hypothetical protein